MTSKEIENFNQEIDTEITEFVKKIMKVTEKTKVIYNKVQRSNIYIKEPSQDTFIDTQSKIYSYFITFLTNSNKDFEKDSFKDILLLEPLNTQEQDNIIKNYYNKQNFEFDNIFQYFYINYDKINKLLIKNGPTLYKFYDVDMKQILQESTDQMRNTRKIISDIFTIPENIVKTNLTILQNNIYKPVKFLANIFKLFLQKTLQLECKISLENKNYISFKFVDDDFEKLLNTFQEEQKTTDYIDLVLNLDTVLPYKKLYELMDEKKNNLYILSYFQEYKDIFSAIMILSLKYYVQIHNKKEGINYDDVYINILKDIKDIDISDMFNKYKLNIGNRFTPIQNMLRKHVEVLNDKENKELTKILEFDINQHIQQFGEEELDIEYIYTDLGSISKFLYLTIELKILENSFVNYKNYKDIIKKYMNSVCKNILMLNEFVNMNTTISEIKSMNKKDVLAQNFMFDNIDQYLLIHSDEISKLIEENEVKTSTIIRDIIDTKKSLNTTYTNLIKTYENNYFKDENNNKTLILYNVLTNPTKIISSLFKLYVQKMLNLPCRVGITNEEKYIIFEFDDFYYNKLINNINIPSTENIYKIILNIEKYLPFQEFIDKFPELKLYEKNFKDIFKHLLLSFILNISNENPIDSVSRTIIHIKYLQNVSKLQQIKNIQESLIQEEEKLYLELQYKKEKEEEFKTKQRIKREEKEDRKRKEIIAKRIEKEEEIMRKTTEREEKIAEKTKFPRVFKSNRFDRRDVDLIQREKGYPKIIKFSEMFRDCIGSYDNIKNGLSNTECQDIYNSYHDDTLSANEKIKNRLLFSKGCVDERCWNQEHCEALQYVARNNNIKTNKVYDLKNYGNFSIDEFCTKTSNNEKEYGSLLYRKKYGQNYGKKMIQNIITGIQNIIHNFLVIQQEENKQDLYNYFGGEENLNVMILMYQDYIFSVIDDIDMGRIQNSTIETLLNSEIIQELLNFQEEQSLQKIPTKPKKSRKKKKN